MPLGFLKALGKPRFTWGYQTEPEPHPDGSSTINGMCHIRGHRADHDEWRHDFGCEGWASADVLPYFKRSETTFRGETEDYDGAKPDGFARGQVAIDPQGRRASSARGSLRPVMGRPNLTVWTLARTRRVIVEGGRATGVEVDHTVRVRYLLRRRKMSSQRTRMPSETCDRDQQA